MNTGIGTLNANNSSTNLKLELKSNYRVAPINNHGLNFLGYIFYSNRTLLRKKIVKSIKKITKEVLTNPNEKNIASLNSYRGWMKSSDSFNLAKSIGLTLAPRTLNDK